MNEFGLAVLGAAARVTILTLAAVPLCVAAGRRGPRAGAAAATAALAGCVALTLFSFVPLPDWWSWSPARRGEPSAAPSAVEAGSAAPAGSTEGVSAPGVGVSLADVLTFLSGLRREAEEAGPRSGSPASRWPAWLAAVLLVGASLGLLRLVLGLWAVARERRRARLVTDPELLGLVEELRAAMGCRRRVMVCETPTMTSAATAGWLRPTVFLPPDWRGWTEEERRAVLAHELAHVRCGDYLTGMLAGLGLTLHFYHPLVRWLAGRLHLEQELAADAVGVRFAGGRGPYLRALARLALRQDGQTLTGPGRAFLSARGTLKRRIQMLRTKDSSAERPPSWLGRAAVVVLLSVAVGASSLRATGLRAEGAPPAAPQAPSPEARRSPAVAPAEAAPFDVSAVPAGAKGVWAIRPAAVFGQPGMKEYAEKSDKALALVFTKALGLDRAAFPSVADFDQVVGTLTLEPDSAHKGRSSLMMDLRLLRTTHDFDWKKLFGALLPKAVEVRVDGGSYYRVLVRDLSPLLRGLAGVADLPFCYQIADARTVVIGSEEELRRRLSGKKTNPPTHAWDAEWKAVEREQIALAVDGKDKTWLYQRDKSEDPVSVALTDLARKTEAVAVGLSAGNGLTVTLLARCHSAKEAATVSRRGLEVIAEARKDVVKVKLEGATEDSNDVLIRTLLTAEWMVSRPPTGDERSVGWRCHCAKTLPELIELIAGGSSK